MTTPPIAPVVATWIAERESVCENEMRRNDSFWTTITEIWHIRNLNLRHAMYARFVSAFDRATNLQSQLTICAAYTNEARGIVEEQR